MVICQVTDATSSDKIEIWINTSASGQMKLQTDFQNPVGGFEPRITVPYMTYLTEIHPYVTEILGGSKNFNTGYEKAMTDRKHQRLVESFLLIIV